MARINQLLIRHSDAFYGYRRPTDFRLEERHPQLFPTNVRPETLAKTPRCAGRLPRKAGASPISALHVAGADALPRERPGERPLVSGSRAQRPHAPKQAIVVLPQWNSTGWATILLHHLQPHGHLRAAAFHALHDIRRPRSSSARTMPSAPTSAGRSQPAVRRSSMFAAAWTGWKNRATNTSACWNSLGSATRSWPARTTLACG